MRGQPRIVYFRGRRMRLFEAAALAGLDVNTVWMRIARGWTAERALEVPARALRRREA